MSSRPDLKVCICIHFSPMLQLRRLFLLAPDTAKPQVDDEHGFIRFFKSLPTVGDDVIRIFDRGDWYTAHGENANFIARTVRLSSLSLSLPHPPLPSFFFFKSSR